MASVNELRVGNRRAQLRIRQVAGDAGFPMGATGEGPWSSGQLESTLALVFEFTSDDIHQIAIHGIYRPQQE